MRKRMHVTADAARTAVGLAVIAACFVVAGIVEGMTWPM